MSKLKSIATIVISLFSTFETFLTKLFRPILVVYMNSKLRIRNNTEYFKFDMYMYNRDEGGVRPSYVDATGSYNYSMPLKIWLNFDLRYMK